MRIRRFKSNQELLKRLLNLQLQLKGLSQELQAIVLEAKAERVTLPDLHDQNNHRIDARKIASYLGVPLRRLAQTLKRKYMLVQRSPSAKSLQASLLPLKRTIELLNDFFPDPANARVWLNSPHQHLNNLTAMETILAGKSYAVILLLENAAAGVPV